MKVTEGANMTGEYQDHSKCLSSTKLLNDFLLSFQEQGNNYPPPQKKALHT